LRSGRSRARPASWIFATASCCGVRQAEPAAQAPLEAAAAGAEEVIIVGGDRRHRVAVLRCVVLGRDRACAQGQDREEGRQAKTAGGEGDSCSWFLPLEVAAPRGGP
jgi:hypothetical protein